MLWQLACSDCYILGFFNHIANISKKVFYNKLKEIKINIMKLIDEFKYALWEDTDATGDEVENKCEKIANSFAIGFVEWVRNYTPNTILTTKKLLEIYKKTLE